MPFREKSAPPVFTAPAPDANSIPIPLTPLSVMALAPVPKLSAPLPTKYNFPKATGAVTFGAVE